TLPLIYLLESRLEMFCGGGRSVQVVAFNTGRYLWKYPQHLMLRENALYHLTNHWQYRQQLLNKQTYPLVFTPDSFWSDDFMKYLHVYLPVFALVARVDLSPLIAEESRYLMIYLPIYLKAAEIPVVQSTEVSYRSNAMYAFTMDFANDVEQYIREKLRLPSEVAQPLKLQSLVLPQILPPWKADEALDSPLYGNIFALIEQFPPSLSSSSQNASEKTTKTLLDMRLHLLVYAVISLLKGKSNVTPEEWDLIRLVLLHAVLLEEMPLEYRSQRLPNIVDIAITEDGDESSEDDEDDVWEEKENEKVSQTKMPADRDKKGQSEIRAKTRIARLGGDSDWEDIGDEDEPEPEPVESAQNNGKKDAKKGDVSDAEQAKEKQSTAETAHKESSHLVISASKETNERRDDLRFGATANVVVPKRDSQVSTKILFIYLFVLKEEKENGKDFFEKCWWKRFPILHPLDTLMIHYVNVYVHAWNKQEKVQQIDFEQLVLDARENDPNDNPWIDFLPKTAVDIFDGRLLCQLLSLHEILSQSDVEQHLGLSSNTLSKMSKLFDAVVEYTASSENTKDKVLLFPIIQSPVGKTMKFPEVALQRKKEDHAFVKVDSALVQLRFFFNCYCSFLVIEVFLLLKALVGDFNEDLEKVGLIKDARRVGHLKRRLQHENKVLEEQLWNTGSIVHDQIVTIQEEASQNQKFVRFLEKYAASLEGGKIVLRDVSISKSTEEKKKEEEEQDSGNARDGKGGSKAKGGGKGPKKGGNSVRQKAAEEIRLRQQKEKLEKIENLINVLSGQHKEVEMRISKLDEELSSMDDPTTALPGLQQLHTWCTEAALKSKPERNIYPSVRLWQVTFDIVRRFVGDLNEPEDVEQLSPDHVFPDVNFIQNLQKGLHLFGFEEPAKKIAEFYMTKVNKTNPKSKLTLQSVAVPFRTQSVRISVGTSYARFQMEHCGPFMIRGVGSRPDPRVTGFYPDQWQVKLLDIVDRRQSALVVAPTSSGKTFISYYTMKHILQENQKAKHLQEKGIVIYIAPTKALVWQALGDIYSKYGQKFGDVVGFFTEAEGAEPGNARKALECQILICLPSSFEHLMMSAQRYDLISRIRYVIFDEIHCLGRSEGGEIWERLLLVDNIMREQQEKYRHRVHYVCFNERWSDLEKYTYVPEPTHLFDQREFHAQKPIPSVGGCGTDYKSACIKVHPGAAIAMGLGLDKEDEFPPGLSLSPQDSLYLFDALTKHVSELPPIYQVLSLFILYFGFQILKRIYLNLYLIVFKRLGRLRPDIFFRDDMYVTKRRAVEYERKLKAEIRYWLIGLHNCELLDDKSFQELGMDYSMPLEEEDIREEWQKAQEENATKINKPQGKKHQKQVKQDKPLPPPKGQSKKENRKGKEKEKGKAEEEKKEDHKSEEELLVQESRTCEPKILNMEERKKRKILVNAVLKSLAEYPLQRIERMEHCAEEKNKKKKDNEQKENEKENHKHKHEKDAEAKEINVYGPQFVQDNMAQLLLDLHAYNRLPALIFCLDRIQCEKLVARVLSDLEELEKETWEEENRKKGTDAEVLRRREQKKREQERKKLMRKLEQQARNKASEDALPEDEYTNQLEEFDTEGERKDYRFTFVEEGTEVDPSIKEWWTSRLTRKGWNEKHILLRALDRGIGMHHEGLRLNYRHLVETLFRYRHIKVVISEASLAMGVNMPARTVVFAGDDPALTPLNYRQMMGRAGRRGYDNVGYVIFFGIKPRRVAYLMTSHLTSLNGHFPINTTTSLRSIQLYNGYKSKDEQWAKQTLKNLFQPPFSGRAIKSRVDLQIKHQFRYSLEYQLQHGMLSFQAEFKGLAGLVSHLHSYEPDNYAFAKVKQLHSKKQQKKMI
ncbi:DEAD/DEAH box helicase, partial [Reticulomyxa filosa]